MNYNEEAEHLIYTECSHLMKHVRVKESNNFLARWWNQRDQENSTGIVIKITKGKYSSKDVYLVFFSKEADFSNKNTFSTYCKEDLIFLPKTNISPVVTKIISGLDIYN